MPIMTNDKIQSVSKQIAEGKKELTELKTALEPKKIDDYKFINQENNTTNLSEMFGKHKYLVVIHNMGEACSFCTMWANGFEGIYKHFDDKAGFVMVNHDSIEKQNKFAKKQGWTYPIYNASENSFNKDLGFIANNCGLWPGVSTFRKNSDNSIDLLAQEEFGPGDEFCSVWHIYDLFPENFSY